MLASSLNRTLPTRVLAPPAPSFGASALSGSPTPSFPSHQTPASSSTRYLSAPHPRNAHAQILTSFLAFDVQLSTVDPRISCSLFRFCLLLYSLFSCNYELPNLQVLCFDNYTTVPGVGKYPSTGRKKDEKTMNAQTPDVEIRSTGKSTVAERITAEVKAGNCACEVKNPSGKCCLGDVTRAVRNGLRVVEGKTF